MLSQVLLKCVISVFLKLFLAFYVSFKSKFLIFLIFSINRLQRYIIFHHHIAWNTWILDSVFDVTDRQFISQIYDLDYKRRTYILFSSESLQFANIQLVIKSLTSHITVINVQ